MSFEIKCPVDFKKVNENKVRLTAFWVLLLAILIVLTNSWIGSGFLLVDFALRAFDFGKFSFLNWLSDIAIKSFNFSTKFIDQAPKIFAAKIGLGFTIFILATLLGDNFTLASYITAVLIFFAFLESVLGICAGCYVYTFYKRIFK